MDKELFNAVLAMDAYNRGHAPSIRFTDPTGSVGQSIGNAVIVSQSDVAEGGVSVRSSFYALAYDTNKDGLGDIISYRGTDDPIGDSWHDGDVWNGWRIGTGSLEAIQGQLAIEFYRFVAGDRNYTQAGIDITGHSLGGGLMVIGVILFNYKSRSIKNLTCFP